MESPGESHEELPFVIMVRAGETASLVLARDMAMSSDG